MSRIACAWISVRPNCAVRPALASGGFFEPRISLITASRLSSAMRRPFEDVRARLRLAQLEFDAPAHHLAAELDEVLDDLEEAQHLRPAGDDGQHDDAEGLLQRGVLVEVVEDHLATSPRFSSMTMRMPVAVGFVPQVGDALDGLLATSSAIRSSSFALFTW